MAPNGSVPPIHPLSYSLIHLLLQSDALPTMQGQLVFRLLRFPPTLEPRPLDNRRFRTPSSTTEPAEITQHVIIGSSFSPLEALMAQLRTFRSNGCSDERGSPIKMGMPLEGGSGGCLKRGQAWTFVSSQLVVGKSGASLGRLPTLHPPIRAALWSSSPPGMSLMLSPMT